MSHQAKRYNLVVGVIGGKGRMGALFADLFKKGGYQVVISDLHARLSNQELVKIADIVIVSVPIDVTSQVIKKIVPSLKTNQLLMDLTSIKEEPIREMLKSKAAVIGLHPMFNHTSFGPNQKVAICPARAGEWLPWVKNFLERNELSYFILNAKKHDKIMSIVQALVHFAEISFGRTLQYLDSKVEDLLPFASPASALKIEMVARILAQDPNLYGNIAIQNPGNLEVLSQYMKATEELSDIIKHQDLNKFIAYFKESAKFLGKYANDSLQESDWIIAQLTEKNRLKKLAAGFSISSQQHLPKNNNQNKNADIGLLGPQFTNTAFASEKWIKISKFKSVTRNYYHTIPAVFAAVKAGHIQYGIVPIENALQGTIRDTLDELFFNDVLIIHELSLPIHHCLAVYPGTKKNEIGAIMSHPQALHQCSSYLKKHYTHAELIEFSATAAAMKKLSEQKNPSLAVIGPKKAALAYGLSVIAEKIENNPNNKTTFIVIKKHSSLQPMYPAKLEERRRTTYVSGEAMDNLCIRRSSKSEDGQPKLKTSLAFYFGQNKPGILESVFKDFASAKINLTRIESRPSRKEFGDYVFYLDFEGSASDEKAQKVLRTIRSKVVKLKIFGSYPY